MKISEDLLVEYFNVDTTNIEYIVHSKTTRVYIPFPIPNKLVSPYIIIEFKKYAVDLYLVVNNKNFYSTLDLNAGDYVHLTSIPTNEKPALEVIPHTAKVLKFIGEAFSTMI